MTKNDEKQPQIESLARMVHTAWRDGMLAQGREVATKRLRWETLSKEDQALDRCIAEQMVLVLATQNLPFLPASYTMPTFSPGELRLFAQAGQARGQSLASADQQSGVLMLGLGYGLAQLLAASQAQAEQLARLEDALRWYADSWNYDQGISRDGDPQDSHVQKDAGARARAAFDSLYPVSSREPQP